MVAEIQQLKTECSGYRERLEKIKSASNHVTPEEKEKVHTKETPRQPKTLMHVSSTVKVVCLQVYKERDVYVKEWRKRKRLVGHC